MSIVLFVFTLNEIDGFKKIMPNVKREWVDDIIVVDGGSTDGTIEEAERQSFKIIHQKNKGLHFWLSCRLVLLYFLNLLEKHLPTLAYADSVSLIS